MRTNSETKHSLEANFQSEDHVNRLVLDEDDAVGVQERVGRPLVLVTHLEFDLEG